MSKSLSMVLFCSFSTHFTRDVALFTHDDTHLLMTLLTLLIRTQTLLLAASSIFDDRSDVTH